MRSTTRSSASALRALRGRRTAAPGLVSTTVRRRGLGTLEDAIACVQSVADVAHEGVCVLDLEGRLRYVNTTLQRLLRLAQADLLDRRVDDLCIGLRGAAAIGSATTQPVSLGESVARGHALRDIERLWRVGDGTLVAARCALTPLRAGGLVGASLTLESPRPALTVPTEPAAAGGQTPEQVQGESETRIAERRLRLVEAVSDLALSGLPLEHLLDRLLVAIQAEMRLENVAIFLIDEAAREAVVVAASGAGAEIADTVRVPLGDSVLGEAIGKRHTVYLPSAEVIARSASYFTAALRARMHVQSIIFAPLVVGERSIGALYMGADRPERFNEDDLRLAALMGERAASAIERVRAEEAERLALAAAEEARERLRMLISASSALNASLDYAGTTDRLADCVTPTLADACAVYLLEDDGRLRRVATRAPAADPARPTWPATALAARISALDATIETSLGDHLNTASIVARCVNQGTVQRERLSGPSGDGGAARDVPAQMRAISAPLLVRGHALGALYLASATPDHFNAMDLSLIEDLAERAAIAIDNARLYTETEQARAAGGAMARQLDTIFNATDVGIFVTDTAGAFLRINPYGVRLLGLSESVFERSNPQIFPSRESFELRTMAGDPIPPEAEPLRLARVEDRVIEMRLVIHRRDTGKDIQALARCRPWHDQPGHVAGAIGVVTDISAITELERQKDEFIGIASHELKTPLTSLKILAELLSRRLAQGSDVREQEQAQRMQVAIIRMEKLINDLLDVSRIQEGKLTFNLGMMDLVEICADALHEQELVSNRRINFVAPRNQSLPVYGDAIRIQQVVTNLLSNALKYSRESALVTVRVRTTNAERIVSVEDHGPGVPHEEEWRLFERFSRVPGLQVQSGSGVGLGLGLYICREIVERHGGRIWFESKLGHGSVFSFALPTPRDGQTAQDGQRL